MHHVSPLQNQSARHRAEERVIDASGVRLEATLCVSPQAVAVVALLHASCAGRFAPHNRFNAEVLEQSGLATLGLDLLTPAEEASLAGMEPQARTALLTERVIAAVEWIKAQPETSGLRLGLFASALETAPALLAAARIAGVNAVAVQGGRVDSMEDALPQSLVPTLLLGADEQSRGAELAAEFFVRECQTRS